MKNKIKREQYVSYVRIFLELVKQIHFAKQQFEAGYTFIQFFCRNKMVRQIKQTAQSPCCNVANRQPTPQGSLLSSPISTFFPSYRCLGGKVEIVESAARPADCDEARGTGGGYLSKLRQNIALQSHGKKYSTLDC